MANTYSAASVGTTPAFQVRLLIGDTNTTNYLFDDEEITFFLTRAGSNVTQAAVYALGTVIRSKALLAKITKLGGYMTEEFAIKDLMLLISQLQNELSGGISTIELQTSSEHLDSYAPKWRDIDGTSETIPSDYQ
jgi:hypothetical protein